MSFALYRVKITETFPPRLEGGQPTPRTHDAAIVSDSEEGAKQGARDYVATLPPGSTTHEVGEAQLETHVAAVNVAGATILAGQLSRVDER